MEVQKSQKGADDIIMKRKIYQQLLDWKEKRNGEVALLVEGARRIQNGMSSIKKNHDSKAGDVSLPFHVDIVLFGVSTEYDTNTFTLSKSSFIISLTFPHATS